MYDNSQKGFVTKPKEVDLLDVTRFIILIMMIE